MIWCQWLAKCSIDGIIDEWNQNLKNMLWGVYFMDGSIDGRWQCVLSNIGSFDFCNYIKWMSIWFLISIVLTIFIVIFLLVTTTYHELECINLSQLLRLVQLSI